MKILAIDTSTNRVFIAICNYSEQWICSKTAFSQAERDNDNWLEIHIQEFISEQALEDFDGFAVGYEPGSFTGLRISFTYLKALALLWEKVFFSFSSSWLYHNLLCQPDDILLIQQNRSLFCSYDPEMNVPSDKTQSLDEWINTISPQRHEKIRLLYHYPEQTADKFPVVHVENPINLNMIFKFPDPDFLKHNKMETLKELPVYGHDTITHRKI